MSAILCTDDLEQITNGQYINVYWPDYGILMANDNAGPAYQVEKARGSQIPWEDEKLVLCSNGILVAFRRRSRLTKSPP